MKNLKRKAIMVAFSLIACMCNVFPAQADNPIVQTIYTADGAPMVWNDTFYMYTGHDEGNSGFFSMNDWRCFSTTDMKNWTDLGSPLHYSAFSWAKGEAWAAQVVERDGKFYYYVTVTAKSGGRAIGVAVADNPEGPFTDAIGKPLVGPMDGMKCIDPTVFVDDDGQAYMYFGNGSMWYVLLNDDMISCKGELVSVDVKNGSFGGFYDEAPYLYKRNGKYYMIYAADALPQNVSYSTADSPTGPWKYGGVIMHYQGGNCGTNHPGIADYKGKTYLTYHSGLLEGGGDYARSEGVEELVWGENGTISEIKRSTSGPVQIEALDAFKRTEAETICWEKGVETEACSAGGRNVCDINAGEYIKVSGVDFGGGASSFRASASSANSGGTLELRLGSQTGTLIGSCAISGTGGWQSWKTFTCDITGASGKQDLYLTFTGSGTNPLYNLDWWQFGTASGFSSEVSSDSLIQNLKVNDTENAADWSIAKNFGSGVTIYGDRDLTAASAPASLKGAQYIRTACDSKMYTGELATFTAGADIAVYAAVDARVNTRLDWLNSWTKTGESIRTSNDVNLELFRINVKAGETVTLGTNGGEGESANYLVLAQLLSDSARVRGDVDGDGAVTAIDLSLTKRGVITSQYANEKAEAAADVDISGEVNIEDLRQLSSYVLGKSKGFEQAEPIIPISDFPYESNLQYSKAPDSYLKDCAQQGKVEKITYQTSVYQNNLAKNALVYLPYGYDSSKQYNIFYLMHGGGGNENSIFVEDKALKPILDSMIMNGDIEPMIVVTPTYNNAAGSDMTANSKNFWKELAVDVLPAVESKYSTYAESTSAEDLKASRMHRAFGGFSMGSLCAWYVLLNDLDYFAYHMPLSGDCWAGNTADEKAAAVANACKKSGYDKDEYFILAATGTKDIAYDGMAPQIESMKKLTDTFTYTSDFSKGNFYFLLCEGGSHWWTGYIVNYIYDGLPYFFRENR